MGNWDKNMADASAVTATLAHLNRCMRVSRALLKALPDSERERHGKLAEAIKVVWRVESQTIPDRTLTQRLEAELVCLATVATCLQDVYLHYGAYDLRDLVPRDLSSEIESLFGFDDSE